MSEETKWLLGAACALVVFMGTLGLGGMKIVAAIVSRLVAEATEIKTELRIAMPAIQKIPAIEQNIAVIQSKQADDREDLGKLRLAQHQLAGDLTKVAMGAPLASTR